MRCGERLAEPFDCSSVQNFQQSAEPRRAHASNALPCTNRSRFDCSPVLLYDRAYVNLARSSRAKRSDLLNLASAFRLPSSVLRLRFLSSHKHKPVGVEGPSSPFWRQPSVFRLPISAFRFLASAFRLPSSSIRLRFLSSYKHKPVGVEGPSSLFWRQPSVFRLPSSLFWPSPSVFCLPSSVFCLRFLSSQNLRPVGVEGPPPLLKFS